VAGSRGTHVADRFPPDEGDQLRFEFAQEMQRLAKAA
jgi:hypothetical protein